MFDATVESNKQVPKLSPVYVMGDFLVVIDFLSQWWYHIDMIEVLSSHPQGCHLDYTDVLDVVDDNGDVVPRTVAEMGCDYMLTKDEAGVEPEPPDEESPIDHRRIGREAAKGIVCGDCGVRLHPGQKCDHLAYSQSGRTWTVGSWGYDHTGKFPSRHN